jgi:hypothetical protein
MEEHVRRHRTGEEEKQERFILPKRGNEYRMDTTLRFTLIDLKILLRRGNPVKSSSVTVEISSEIGFPKNGLSRF